MNTNAYTLNLSPEMATRTKELQRESQTPNEVMEQIYKLGLYQLEYRREKNPKKAQEMKEMREVYRRAQKDPELAVRLGLGTRPSL